jgi:hypothetical protein
MAEHLVAELLVAIASFADGEIASLALFTLTADDREGYDDPLANLKRILCTGADLHDFSHGLVTHDVARFHPGHEVVEQVKV